MKGYIKAEYFVTGSEAEALAEELADKIATVNTTTLRVRASADIESDCVTLVPLGEEFMIMESDWLSLSSSELSVSPIVLSSLEVVSSEEVCISSVVCVSS